MKYKLLLLLCLSQPACSLFHHPYRPPHATSKEAAEFQFPLEIPAEGRQIIPAEMAAAIELAADDFLPRDLRIPSNLTPTEVCLARRDSYDVVAAPSPEESVMFVRFTLKDGACGNVPVLDAEATYAVDVRQWRILAVQR